MLDSLFVSENIVHAGALLYLAAFLFRNQIILRSLIIAGDFVYILYFYLAPETPLWGGIFWSTMFTLVNVVDDRPDPCRQDALPPRPQRKAPFRSPAGPHARPVPAVPEDRAGRDRGFSSGITQEGKPLEELYFVLDRRHHDREEGQACRNAIRTPSSARLPSCSASPPPQPSRLSPERRISSGNPPNSRHSCRQSPNSVRR